MLVLHVYSIYIWQDLIHLRGIYLLQLIGVMSPPINLKHTFYLNYQIISIENRLGLNGKNSLHAYKFQGTLRYFQPNQGEQTTSFSIYVPNDIKEDDCKCFK